MLFHISFGIIQILSLLVMFLFIREYKRITKKHERLITTIEHGKCLCSKQQSLVIIWIYIALTCILLFATTGTYFTLSALF